MWEYRESSEGGGGKLMVSERIKKLRDREFGTAPSICLERARMVTRFYEEPSMEPFMLRRARFFQYYLENKTIYIDDEALLAGNQGSRFRSCPVFPEVTAWLLDDIDTIDTRTADSYQFLPGEKDELKEIAAKWKGKRFGDYTKKQISDEVAAMVDAGVFTTGSTNVSTGSHAPAYYDLVKYGYRHYIDACKKKLEAQDDMDIDSLEQKMTWESMIIVLEAIIAYAHRYAELAEKLAEECADAGRKKELLTIAENCRVVPEQKPKNFHQALQLVWFTHLALMLEVNGQNHCFGRFDQYMYPFYEADIKNGVSEDFISDLINELKLKCSDLWVLRNQTESLAYAGCPLWMHLVMGGMLPNGKDGCNALTDLILKSITEFPTKAPVMSFRYHNHVSRTSLRLALAAIRSGASQPAIFNDNVCVPTLLSLGFTLKEARDYSFCGCVETVVPGITDFNANVGYFNPMKVLEITLNNGTDPLTGKQLGPKTGEGEDFSSTAEIMEAYRIQEEYFVKHFLTTFDKIVSCHAYMLPTITASCFVSNCIDSGKVLQQGGAAHKYSAAAITSIANVADSLAAIEVCVFEKNYMTMAELMELLHTNFEGHEDMRQILLNKAPKYGNDDELVDRYARWIVDQCNDDIVKYRDGRGGRYTTVYATQSYNVVVGRLIGATPDGRRAFEDLADNASPTNGQDHCGPTAVVKSVSYLDHFIPQNGILLNQRFDPAVIKGEKGLDILESIVRSFCSMNGEHIQVTVVDTDTLKAAQKDPKSYQNILVRVAGYSAYFVELDKQVQDNIITRTLQQGL